MTDLVRLHLPCARGTELCVQHELTALGATDVKTGQGVVSASGPMALIARANVWLRCASRVLLELERFEGIATEDDLLEALSHVPFETRLDGKGTFCIDAHLRDVPWTHGLYAAQRVKDVIVDRLRALGRGRPTVDTKRPALRYVLHWEKTTATLSLDTTGDPLHERGYRVVPGRAPMKETLAASILAMGHADVSRPFLDPCCGTGTLAIEQALRALDRAPNPTRRFGYERWRDRDPSLDRESALARQEAKDRSKKVLPAPVRLSDWHHEALADATDCVAAAGLKDILVPERMDARQAAAPGDRSVIVSNLPFGERLGQNKLQLEGFYRTLGAHWLEQARANRGARVVVFTSLPGAWSLLNLEPHARFVRRWGLRSGQLDARLLRYDLDGDVAPDVA